MLTEKTAPPGSAMTASREIAVSNGPATTVPPRPGAAAAIASASSTQKFTTHAAGRPKAGAMTATTSRGTGCPGSPPT